MDFDSDTRLRLGFFLTAGCAPGVSTVRRKTRQNRSTARSPLRKNSPAASTASMANARASTAVALVTDSSRCRSSPFNGLPFAATILARHFPGSCSKAVISSPLYCIARPGCVFITGRKGEQRLAATLKNLRGFPSTSGFRPTQIGTSLIVVYLPNQAADGRPSPCPRDNIRTKSRGRIAHS